MSIVDEFWIITWDGIPLFNYSRDNSIDSNLIGGFFSALQTFVKEFDDSNDDTLLNNFSSGQDTFYFLSNNVYNLYFITKTTVDLSSKIIYEHLKAIENIFLNEYRKELVTFDYEIGNFKRFQTKFEKYCYNNFNKLKGIW